MAGNLISEEINSECTQRIQSGTISPTIDPPPHNSYQTEVKTNMNNDIVPECQLKETSNNFCTDYSIRGTAKCRKCKLIIAKNIIRIGKYTEFKGKSIKHYYHLPCAFKSFEKARVITNVITSIDEIDDFSEIKEADRIIIKEMIDEGNLKRKKILIDSSHQKKRKVPELLLLEDPTIKRCKLKSTTSPSIKIMYTNTDQMTTTKKNELQKRIENEKPLVVAITEMKPKNPGTSQIEYDIPNYTLHPVNLTNNNGRGIAVYTHTSIDKSVIQIKSKIDYEETCLLEIRLRQGDTLLFGCCYRSPTPSPSSNINNKNLIELLKSVASKKYSHVCIVGDFNYKKINWKSWTSPGDEDTAEFAFIEGIRDCFLHQHIEEPTRRRGDDEPSLLDLVLTNEDMQVSNLKHRAPLGKSDHDVILFDFHCYLNYSSPKERFLWNKGNYDAMREHVIEEGWKDKFITASSQLINTNSSRV